MDTPSDERPVDLNYASAGVHRPKSPPPLTFVALMAAILLGCAAVALTPVVGENNIRPNPLYGPTWLTAFACLDAYVWLRLNHGDTRQVGSILTGLSMSGLFAVAAAALVQWRPHFDRLAVIGTAVASCAVIGQAVSFRSSSSRNHSRPSSPSSATDGPAH